MSRPPATLGASRLMCFATITLPMILPGLIAGVVLGFAKAMGEFGATITFVSSISRADPDASFRDLHVPAGAGRRDRGAAADAWCRSQSP